MLYLKLPFVDSDGGESTLTIANPKESLSKAEATSCMTAIIGANCLHGKNGGMVKGISTDTDIAFYRTSTEPLA